MEGGGLIFVLTPARVHKRQFRSSSGRRGTMAVTDVRFALDDPEAGLKFSERLARENLWTKEYTLRVLEEYKRFLILRVEAGHPG